MEQLAEPEGPVPNLSLYTQKQRPRGGKGLNQDGTAPTEG